MKVKSVSALALLGVFLTTIFTPIAAVASSKGRRNTAIALTAASLYTLAKGRRTAGLALAAGSTYAWKRYGDSRNAEVRHRSYRRGYRTGYKSGYTRGKCYAYGHSKKSRYYARSHKRYYVARR